IFTTHTPVSAGHDTFAFADVERIAGPFWNELGMERDDFARLGRHPADTGGLFHMTVAALRLSGRVHAVAPRQQLESPPIWRDPAKLAVAGTLLSPTALTIGFARRFATYKRADLVLRDPERLRRLLVNARRPVQFVFAGKAHPADDPGKEVLQKVYLAAQDPH